MVPLQIVLVDDHRLFRSGIASLINKLLPHYKILFEASDGEELMRKLTPKLKPDIVLLDINMPKKDGIATALWLRSTYPDVNIIVLSMFEDADKVLQMVKMGVKGYLLKDAEPHEFEQALQRVAQGEVYYPDFVTRHLLNNFNQQQDQQIKLNNREIAFLKLAGTELTYKEIAAQMCVSPHTVDNYRDALFQKLDLKSRTGLVIFALKYNIANC